MFILVLYLCNIRYRNTHHTQTFQYLQVYWQKSSPATIGIFAFSRHLIILDAKLLFWIKELSLKQQREEKLWREPCSQLMIEKQMMKQETREKAIKTLENKGYEIVNTLLRTSGTAKKNGRKRSCDFLCLASWRNRLKIWAFVMRPISAKDGKMQEAAGLNMRQLRHMDLILSTRIRLIAV